ncbi:adenosylcobinamide-GDP ribazoletransferase [Thermithiobacillus plumbiphilus]|uniref:Adenosylcobinamide-GDP ribazoletransferase n=1 Tax=Thermithiobacillus plumbiphilus TaxID=1729899 RepID=A0ABU9D4Z1_9PROT
MIHRELRRLCAALGFFTRIPCPRNFGPVASDLQDAAKYLPLVGWLVGGAAALVVWLAGLVFPQPVAVLLSLLATLLLTGAIHEDGFADSCDGFGGGWTREQILGILQDSRIGAFGAIGLFMLLGLKVLSLSGLPATALPLALIAAHSLSRLFAISFMQTHVYVRVDGSGKSGDVARKLAPGSLLLAVIIGLAPLLLISPTKALGIVLVLLFARWLLGRYFARRLGGYTGDCLGAAQQLSEVLVYLVILALA